MKTLLTALALLSTLSAHAAPLEGGLDVQAKMLDVIRWEHHLCERGAFVTVEIERDNSSGEDAEIAARFEKTMRGCDDLAARRERRLKQGAVNAATPGLLHDGKIDESRFLELLDQSDGKEKSSNCAS